MAPVVRSGLKRATRLNNTTVAILALCLSSVRFEILAQGAPLAAETLGSKSSLCDQLPCMPDANSPAHLENDVPKLM